MIPALLRTAAQRWLAVAATVALGAASGVPASAEELGLEAKSGLHYLEIVTAGGVSADPLPIVVAMHGLGDHPGTFRLLLDDMPARARVILPRGPMPHGDDGFSWFDFHPDDEKGAQQLVEGVRVSAERVATLIVGLSRKYGGPERVVVCGFSQGAMLSFALAAAHPEIVAEAIPVSGYLPTGLWPAERPRVRPLPMVVALHGADDALISPERARWSIEVLRSNGYDTTLRTWPGIGHALSQDMRATLVASVVGAVEKLAPKGSVLQGPPRPRAFDESTAPARAASSGASAASPP